MESLRLFSFLIPPLIAALIFLYLKYRFPGSPTKPLLRAFAWGMVSIVLVIAMQLFASVFQLDQLHTIRRIIFYALVVMAFFSELGKFFILKILIYHRKEFNTPVDGIIYGVIISLGFATMNNIIYLFNFPNLTVNLANAFTAGPAAVVFGVMMGFFVGLGKLRRMRIIDSMTGLAAAIFFHALYDFCLLTEDYRLLWALFAGSAIIVVSLCFAAIRIHQEAKIEEKK